MGTVKNRLDRGSRSPDDVAVSLGPERGRRSTKSPVRCIVELCVLFTLPQALCRFHVLAVNWPRTCWDVVLILAQGVLEDLAVSLQLALFALALYRVVHRQALVVGLALVALLAALPPILDLSVQLCGFARITRVEIEATFHHWRHMTSSMVDRALSLEAYFYFFAFSLLVYAMTWKTYSIVLDAAIVRRSLLVACLIGAVLVANIAVVFRLLLPRACAYLAGNLSFTLEFGQAPMPANVFDRWPSAHIDLRKILDPSEVFNDSIRSDVEFPLWRQTRAYRGPKRFELDLDPNRLPNLLLINMESWSHAVTGRSSEKFMGASLTPYFDRLAAQGIQFESHFNPGLTTTNTLFSQLFGLKPRFSYNPPYAQMGGPFRMYGLPQLLQTHGYACKLISGTSFTWHNWRTFLKGHRFQQLFDDNDMKNLQDELGSKIPSRAEAWGVPDEFSAKVLEYVIKNSSQAAKPYFISFYSISSHDPFRIPDGAPERGLDAFRTGTKLDQAYMRAIRYSDRQLGSVLDRLRAADSLSNTIVIITGDHGRIMGDGSWSRLQYDQFMSDPYSHVPFAIVPSSDLLPRRYRGLKIDQVSSHVDILATVADMLQLPPFWQHGIGASLMRSQDRNRKVIVDQPQPGRELVTVMRDDVKFVFDAAWGFCSIYNRSLLGTTGDVPATSCWHPKYLHDTKDALAWAKRVSTWTSMGYRKGRFRP